MPIRVISGNVDTGNKVYYSGEVISELSASDEKELVANGAGEWVGSQQDEEGEDAIPLENQGESQEDDGKGEDPSNEPDSDDLNPEEDDVANESPQTNIPGLEEPEVEQRRGRRKQQ